MLKDKVPHTDQWKLVGRHRTWNAAQVSASRIRHDRVPGVKGYRAKAFKVGEGAVVFVRPQK